MTAIALVALLASAGAASALQRPGRTIVRGGAVGSVGLTGASIAFSVRRTPADCDHVELWNADDHGTWRFGRRRPCGDLPLFSGIGQIGVAGHRAVWISYAGGNLTDWELWTATATKKTPRRLAFLERDTSDPAPVVVGAGTALGVPYAVETTVTWLGSNGAAIFRSDVPGAVRAVTSGNGPNGWRVAALLDTGDVVALNQAGAIDATYSFPPDQVRWIGLAPAGLVVQLPKAKVEIRSTRPTRTIQLPANAIVVDYAEGRILYRVGQSYRLRSLGTGADVALLQGSRKSRLVVALDTHGLAWAQGRTVNWACSVCIKS